MSAFEKEFKSLNITGGGYTEKHIKELCKYFYEFGLRENRGKIEKLDKDLRNCLLKVSKINTLLSSTKELLISDDSTQLEFNFKTTSK